MKFTVTGSVTVKCCAVTGYDAALPVKIKDELDSAAHYVLITVRDSGIGIAEEDLAKVFEEFRQVDGSHTRRFGGTGLGLAISKRLVELHAGWIWVDSVLDEGSVFSVLLPIDGVTQAPAANT